MYVARSILSDLMATKATRMIPNREQKLIDFGILVVEGILWVFLLVIYLLYHMCNFTRYVVRLNR